MNEDNIELTLTLNVNEVNMVLNHLAKPVENINALIQKIKQQGDAQISKIQEDIASSMDNEPVE
jgi:hypothetical protein